MIQKQINGEKLRFKEIFEKEFSEKEEYTVKIGKIVIPELQRDYAQGRKTARVNGIRENLLNDIKNAIQDEKELTLDFIYGKIQGENHYKMDLIPLDGQQRLTTLFLLNWYALNSFELRGETRPDKIFNLESKFSYQSRPSARDFCEFLSEEYNPQITKDIILSKDIRNDISFPESWEDDPSVDSMLVMLDDIHKKFHDVANMYSGLNKFIHFYFLPLEDMGATDSLYIKMNSRGRALTDFEIAKAILKKYMDEMPEIDNDFNKNLMNNFDVKWTDALWEIVDKDAKKLDNAYLIYIKYICDILCLQNSSLELNNRIPIEQNWSDDMTINDLIKKYYSKENVHAVDNLKKLNAYLSCLPYIAKFNYDDFFYNDMYENGKVKDFKNEYRNIIKKTLNGKIKAVEAKDFAKIYFLLSYIRNFKVNDSINIDENEIKQRFRIIRNLIQHSDDEVAIRKDKNTFPATLEQIDYIMKYGKINDDIEIETDKSDTDNTENKEKTQPQPFNSLIKQEEKEKIEWLKENQKYRDSLYKLEDNEMLKGKISIVGWDNPKYFDRFEKLFKCDCEKIDRALMATEDTIYGVDIRKKNQFGSENPISWYNIFTNWDKSNNEEKYHNKIKLQTLLNIEKLDLITPDGKGVEEAQKELDDICDEILNTDKYDFRYYYVKYESFRPKDSGKYDINGDSDYEIMVQPTSDRLSISSYQPFLKECENEKNKRKPEKWGLVALNLDEDKIIKCVQSGFEIEDIKTKEKRFIDINQDENNTDTEDRIEKLKNILNTSVTDVWNNAVCCQN